MVLSSKYCPDDSCCIILVRAGFDSYWVAGRRPPGGGEQEFYWHSSGAPLTYTRWSPSQPHEGTSDADCIMAMRNSGWRWDDNSCRARIMYICQIVNNWLLQSVIIENWCLEIDCWYIINFLKISGIKLKV